MKLIYFCSRWQTSRRQSGDVRFGHLQLGRIFRPVDANHRIILPDGGKLLQRSQDSGRWNLHRSSRSTCELKYSF